MGGAGQPEPSADAWHWRVVRSARKARRLASFWRGAIFVKPDDDSVAAAATIPEWEKVMPLFAAALPVSLRFLIFGGKLMLASPQTGGDRLG